jgi:excisionase family DNA binding protein
MPRKPTVSTDRGPALLTVRDIAQMDNCSEKTVRRAIASGLLEAIRIGPGGRLLRIHPTAHASYRKAQRI